jgi:hypothetical protein
MATASNATPPSESERQPALLDHPQPLGFLPTLRFWSDPECDRLSGIPRAIFVFVLLIVIGLIQPSWWIGGLAAVAGILLWQGLFERYIRQAAKRRFRSRPEPPALPDNSGPGRDA